ncbi:MAG: glycyl-radical enzyme activating protein [Fimbriimonadales bacterium]|nr:glycyl-radical enzyme activating protein [Fimbriimonadales bacterium]
MATGFVFHIQRFSVADGPGIRTTVFLKGCNLRCFWCHNPESWDAGLSIEEFPERCIGCAECVRACPKGARERVEDRFAFDRERCELCGACVEACVADAIQGVGRRMTVSDTVAELERDRPFFEQSGGGVTVSGGEPLLQAEFVLELLAELGCRGLHTAVDTAGHVSWEVLQRAASLASLVLYDLKAFDGALHASGTGRSNELILENLRRLGDERAPVWVRIPLIPGFNDAPSELAAMADWIGRCRSVLRIELLGYHRLGEGKRDRLGLPRSRAVEPPSVQALRSAASVLEASGKPVVVR